LIVIVIGFDIWREIDDFAGCQSADMIQVNCLTVVVSTIEGFIEAGCPSGHADLLAAFGLIARWNFIFSEDGFKWTFGDAGPAIDAGVWVDVKPRPLIHRFSGDNTFHRTYIHAPRVAKA
jgi:hypothetical protein